MTSIDIEGKRFGSGHPPLIVAELSGNHDGSVETAHAVIDAVADAGADAVKLQTYTADSLTIDAPGADFLIRKSNTPWEGRNLYALYEEACTPWEWHGELFEHARQRDLVCFSSPFDLPGIELLESLDCPAYKIASLENNHLELIRAAAATGKPLIISSGLATAGELERAIATARDAGAENVVVLKCTSSYPADPASTNLRTIPHMRELLGCPVGLSDHTLGIGVPLAATAMGVVLIEKHITLSRGAGGVDSAFSLEPDELKALVVETRSAFRSLGSVHYGPTEEERGSIAFRRSLYFVRDLDAGDVVRPDDIRVIRPGYGLPPFDREAIVGLTLRSSVGRGDRVSWQVFQSGDTEN